MTCIVGYEENGSVWIGGDSAGVSRSSIEVRADRKVFKNGEFIMGFTSSFRMGQLLQYRFKPPQHDSSIDIETYMCTDFIDGVRECLNEYNYGYNKEGDVGGSFLVGYKGRLFTVHGDYQVGWNHTPYSSTGSGEDIALGALHAINSIETGLTISAKDKILHALNAASYFATGVCGPFHVIELENS